MNPLIELLAKLDKPNEGNADSIAELYRLGAEVLRLEKGPPLVAAPVKLLVSHTRRTDAPTCRATEVD